MPRRPRFNLPGIPQHIVQRGNNRAPCFFDEKDRWQYLEDLAESAEKYLCEIHAYVLMTITCIYWSHQKASLLFRK